MVLWQERWLRGSALTQSLSNCCPICTHVYARRLAGGAAAVEAAVDRFYERVSRVAVLKRQSCQGWRGRRCNPRHGHHACMVEPAPLSARPLPLAGAGRPTGCPLL